MDKTTLVTGATGLVGYNIIAALLKRNRKVRALVRSIEKAQKILPKEVEIIQGDITVPKSLAKAMVSCDIIYHAAGHPEQWMKDPTSFQKVNVEGTRNMIRAAREANIERFIYTSTIDVFEGEKGELFDESLLDSQPKGTAYERSKQEADLLVSTAVHDGFPAIFLHPAAVYGCGPVSSPGINDFIKDLKSNAVPMLLPGGMPLAFAEDVGEGHVLAEEKGKTGDRFILCENYYTLHELATIIIKELKINKTPPKIMPLPVVRLVSTLGEWWSGITGKPPLIPKGQLHFLLWQAIPNSQKAQTKLGWKPHNVNDGIQKTCDYLFNSQ